MIILTVTENQGNQRLDRFLKKYLNNSSLSYIYKLIRKDVKVNGKRAREDYFLMPGDELKIYMDEDALRELQKTKKIVKVKRQFKIAYEDENIIVVEKPFGLLTHGDKTEKKNHLANQVIDYLIETGQYNPGREKTFTPAPANRLDRNTTGLVVFGKNSLALQQLNKIVREKQSLHKIYLTVVAGKLEEKLILSDRMVKDQERNRVSIVKDITEPEHTEGSKGKDMLTYVFPIESSMHNGRWYTLVEVEIITGRTHQIRVQLSAAGFPVIGDAKYGNAGVNRAVAREFGLTTQLLHSYKLIFGQLEGTLAELSDLEVVGQLPPQFALIKNSIFDIDEE